MAQGHLEPKIEDSHFKARSRDEDRPAVEAAEFAKGGIMKNAACATAKFFFFNERETVANEHGREEQFLGQSRKIGDSCNGKLSGKVYR